MEKSTRFGYFSTKTQPTLDARAFEKRWGDKDPNRPEAFECYISEKGNLPLWMSQYIDDDSEDDLYRPLRVKLGVELQMNTALFAAVYRSSIQWAPNQHDSFSIRAVDAFQREALKALRKRLEAENLAHAERQRVHQAITDLELAIGSSPEVAPPEEALVAVNAADMKLEKRQEEPQAAQAAGVDAETQVLLRTAFVAAKARQGVAAESEGAAQEPLDWPGWQEAGSEAASPADKVVLESIVRVMGEIQNGPPNAPLAYPPALGEPWAETARLWDDSELQMIINFILRGDADLAMKWIASKCDKSAIRGASEKSQWKRFLRAALAVLRNWEATPAKWRAENRELELMRLRVNGISEPEPNPTDWRPEIRETMAALTTALGSAEPAEVEAKTPEPGLVGMVEVAVQAPVHGEDDELRDSKPTDGPLVLTTGGVPKKAPLEETPTAEPEPVGPVEAAVQAPVTSDAKQDAAPAGMLHWPDLNMLVSLDDDMLEYRIGSRPAARCHYNALKLTPTEFETLQGLALVKGDGSKGEKLNEAQRKRFSRLNKNLCAFFNKMRGPAISKGRMHFNISVMKPAVDYNRDLELDQLTQDQKWDAAQDSGCTNDEIDKHLRNKIEERKGLGSKYGAYDFMERDDDE